MKERSEEVESRARVLAARVGAGKTRHQTDERERKVFGVGRIVALALGAIAVAVLVTSCGQSGGDHTQSSQRVAAEPAVATVASTSPAPVPPPGSRPATVVDDGMSPDLSFTVADTLVSPGEAIEIAVQATPDVRTVTLADGSGSPEAFVHDDTTDVWRVGYRVPLKPRQDRLGLSITARTAADRWRRVWVFLRIQKPAVEGEEKLEPDSASAK
ncbi:MAG: hypothetical protein ACHQ52_11955 [Candidatus Eisenbacteria bacterium]